LGHIVGKDGVYVDHWKIEAMKDWLYCKSLKHLRGFIVLTRYYIKFSHNYGKIVAPLTALLEKNDFSWNRGVDQSFQDLKEDMCTTPVLALHEFIKSFIF